MLAKVAGGFWRIDDATANAKRAALEAALNGAPADVGIVFGQDLFSAFRKRGWFTLEVFGWLGTTITGVRLPAYNKHYASVTWDIPDDDFKVGK